MKLKDIRILFLGLTNKCNGRCITCWHSNRLPFPNHEISLDIYEQVKDKLFKNIKILNLVGGGETMLYSRIDKVLEDVKKYKFKTVITSNFTSMSEKQKELLSDINIDFVASLDGSNAKLQEFIRPSCIYQAAIDNIKYFVNKRKKVVIQTTVSDHNFYDMENMIRLAESLNVEGIRFHSVQYLSHLDNPLKFKKPSEDMNYIDKILKKKYSVGFGIYLDFYHKQSQDAYRPLYLFDIWSSILKKDVCSHARNTIKIQENGMLATCCLPACKIAGDLNFHSIEEIIDTPQYDGLIKTCKCPNIQR